MLFHAVSILALAAIAAARPQQSCEILCVDAISDCGVPYGGCYNPCTDPKPVPPPCSTSSAPASCPTICVDAVNDCGVRYGSCYPSCSTQLRPTPPPCPMTTTSTTASACTSTGTICEDRLKTCGSPTPTATLMWGGCRGACESPTFTEPDCPEMTIM